VLSLGNLVHDRPFPSSEASPQEQVAPAKPALERRSRRFSPAGSQIAPHDSECSRLGAAAGGVVGAAGRLSFVPPPSSRPQLEELRAGDGVRCHGRPAVHTTTGTRSRYANRCGHSKSWSAVQRR